MSENYAVSKCSIAIIFHHDMTRRLLYARYMHVPVAFTVQSLVEWARHACTLVFVFSGLGTVVTLFAILAGRVGHHFLSGLVVSIFTRFDWINSY